MVAWKAHSARGWRVRVLAAFGEINVFGSGSVILTSDFGFANLNGQPGARTIWIFPSRQRFRRGAGPTGADSENFKQLYFVFRARRLAREPKLTLNLGLRWDFDTDATGTSSPYGPCPNLTEEPTSPCVWMANVIDLRHHPDKKNFGPRIGICIRSAWTGKNRNSRRLRNFLRPDRFRGAGIRRVYTIAH